MHYIFEPLQTVREFNDGNSMNQIPLLTAAYYYTTAIDLIDQLEKEEKITSEEKRILISYFNYSYESVKKRIFTKEFLSLTNNLFEDTFQSISDQLINIHKQSMRELYSEQE